MMKNIVGADSIATKGVPNSCIVVNYPVRIIRRDIHTMKFGKLVK